MAKQPTATEQPFKDYYEILHLHAEADAAMVDQAYWHLARLYNAAIPSDAQAREQLDELNEAYSVLRSSELRAACDNVRKELLSEGALSQGLDAAMEQEAPPLAVMAKQRPKPRKKTKPKPKEAGAEPQSNSGIRLRELSMPPWQSLVGALIIFVLATAALIAGTPPLLVVALLIIGLVFTLVPVVRKLPRLPTLPSSTLQLPSIRAPRLPERHSEPSLDADVLRRSTEAMRQRWRVEPGGSPLAFPEHRPWPETSPRPPDGGDGDKDEKE